MSRPFTFEELRKYFNPRMHQEVHDATQFLNKTLRSTNKFLVTKNSNRGDISFPFFSVYFFSPTEDDFVYTVTLLFVEEAEKTWMYDLSKYQLDTKGEIFTVPSQDQTIEETELIQKVREHLQMYLEEHPSYRLLFVTGEHTIDERERKE